MHYIPGCRLRLDDEDAEIIGIDDAEMGEFAYDYVGIDTELGISTAAERPYGFNGNITTGGREPVHANRSASASDSGEATKEIA